MLIKNNYNIYARILIRRYTKPSNIALLTKIEDTFFQIELRVLIFNVDEFTKIKVICQKVVATWLKAFLKKNKFKLNLVDAKFNTLPYNFIKNFTLLINIFKCYSKFSNF